MGFVHFGENGWLVDKNGEPFYLTGINYIAKYVCTDFFSDFREEILEKDLAKIEEMGLNAVRVPVNWGNAEPAEGIFNEQYFVNFSRFLEMAIISVSVAVLSFVVGILAKKFLGVDL